jgi:hypothetical protein
MQKKETTPTTTLRASELRIGNLIEYLCYDELATPKEEWVENYVDIDDLKWLNENPDDNFYRPMKLTEDILKRFGFEKKSGEIGYSKGKLSIYLGDTILSGANGRTYFNNWAILEKSPDYAHQLQNLYFALTGEELTL